METQGVQGNAPVWVDLARQDKPQETEREKLQKTDVWTYAAQQAGAYMS